MARSRCLSPMTGSKMPEEWLTYREIGARLGLNVEAVRTRVRRAGNDGRTQRLPTKAPPQQEKLGRPPPKTLAARRSHGCRGYVAGTSRGWRMLCSLCRAGFSPVRSYQRELGRLA
jgi:hypothetical protein